MNTSQRSVALRATALAVASTATLLGLLVSLGRTIDLDPGQQFAALLAQWSAVVLLGCAGWAWLLTSLVLAEAIRMPSGQPLQPLQPQRRGIPTAYRRLVLGACGLALSAGAATPALATPGPVHLGPQPAVTAAPSAQARAPMHLRAPVPDVADADAIVVHAGDSLWRLTADRLPRDADDATIEHAWRRLYAANSELIGADPDHVEPGQRLARPQGW
ncbi:hypothetical protein [Nocardioides sp. Iso805N]|uniref:hypothetical protein n=1 Tax=Nocardioides sp. Iso805N TaxID=1283287 RepID=UPI00039E9A9C|nr:hypothetical protein [Nocardioides sp. Iso805N]